MKDGIIIVLIISSLFLFGCGPKLTFPILSKKIYTRNGGVNDKSTFKLNYYEKDARMKIYLQDSASFLKGKIDTVFLLEGYNIETATFYETIWNKWSSVSCSYYKGNIALRKQPLFTNYQIQLITHWDTSVIRREEKANGNWFDNNMQISGLRCYKKGKTWHIDEIFFKDFYKSRRDD